MGEKLPLTKNVRWFQLAFGAFAAVLGYQLYLHYAGEARLATGGVVLRILGLAVSLLVFVIYLQNVHRFGLVPDYSLKCRFCNGPVNRYSEFCEHCGADLIAEEKLVVCAKCGTETYEGTKHCPECGARIPAPKGKGQAAKGKGKAPPPEEGWDTPIDATTGIPPPRREDER